MSEWHELNDRAWALFGAGSYDEAYRVAATALASAESALGARHADLVRLLHTLGQISIARSELDDAFGFLKRALDLCTTDDPNLGAVLLALADISSDSGDSDAAVPLYKRVIALYGDEKRARPAANDARMQAMQAQAAQACNGLAIAYYRSGDRAQASKAFARALDLFIAAYGADHPQTQAVRDNMAALSSR